MKKVLVAGAALLIAGSMVSAAYAEVNLSGDARVRWVSKDNYQFGNGGAVVDGQWVSQDWTNYFDSRIRLAIDAKTNGGAFAKARIRLNDFRWDGQGGDASVDKNIYTDYGFIGVPVGPVAILGGVVPWDVTKFFQWDIRPTVAALNYSDDHWNVFGLAIVANDDVNFNDNLKDNNARIWGAYAKYTVNDSWSVLGYGLYLDDQVEWTEGLDAAGDPALVKRDGDNSGFLGTLHVDGNAGGVAMEGEYAYISSDVQGTEDAGWGLYGKASYTMGGLTPALSVGVTKDGYMADGDFGWLMLGDIEPIGVIKHIGGNGDWFWIAPTVDYAVSDNLKLTGNVVWVDVDGSDVNRLANLLEISGKATYTVSEGANLIGALGYLQPDFDGRLDGLGIEDDGAFGAMAKMEIKF